MSWCVATGTYFIYFLHVFRCTTLNRKTRLFMPVLVAVVMVPVELYDSAAANSIVRSQASSVEEVGI